jgi:two-component system OmpR family sensor kinase
VSLRLRITAAFIVAVAVALVAVGVVMHSALKVRLNDALDEALETRATAIARLLVERGEPQPGLTEGIDDPGETFTQVVGPGDRLRISTPGLPLRPLLDLAERRRAAAGGLDIRLDGVRVDDADEAVEEIDLEALEETGTEAFETDRARVKAAAVDVGGRRFWIITGATFENRDEALAELRGVMWLSAPLALVLVGLAGFAAVGRALRPLDKTLHRLERALANERKLVADVSHELRTPLALISGELELALADGASREEAQESMRVAADEARRLGRIGEDLLLLARADAERLELRREALDARALLETTQRRFATRGEVVVDAPEGVVVHGDRLRLEQALGNLVENALTHGRAPVVLRATRSDGEVVLAARDHGDGFPPDVLPHAFERFARSGAGRSGPGTGLGLAIVQVVAEAHGGRAEVVTAENGGGAEVRLRLS